MQGSTVHVCGCFLLIFFSLCAPANVCIPTPSTCRESKVLMTTWITWRSFYIDSKLIVNVLVEYFTTWSLHCVVLVWVRHNVCFGTIVWRLSSCLRHDFHNWAMWFFKSPSVGLMSNVRCQVWSFHILPHRAALSCMSCSKPNCTAGSWAAWAVCCSEL